MPDFGNNDFEDWFAFGRPVAGAYRDQAGVPATAAIDEPRFDHDADGKPLGLLIEAGDTMGRGDRVTVQPGQLDELVELETTILHASIAAGVVERRAWYSRDARRTVEALLAQAGHHLSIAVIPGFLSNRGAASQPGFVRYRRLSWWLAGGIDVGGGYLMADDQGNPIIEG